MELPDPVLAVRGLSAQYGSITALEKVNLMLRPGEAIGVLGANGAGKTTLLNVLSGFLKPSSGSIEFRGRRIDREPPHRIVRCGLLHVSQERDLFGTLSVIENLRLGAVAKGHAHLAHNLEQVFTYFPRLKERRSQQSNTMSGGEQQMLAIGRALMAEPQIMMFDEPSAGLSPLFTQEIGAMMLQLKREAAISIILVEQNMGLAAKVVDRYYMLRDGHVATEGGATDLLADPEELARRYYL